MHYEITCSSKLEISLVYILSASEMIKYLLVEFTNLIKMANRLP